MNFRTATSFFVIWVLVLGITSCEKGDEIQPDISIVSPLENTLFNVYDTVNVQFTISDETQLVSVTVKIVNMNFIPVTDSHFTELSGSTYSGSAEVIISDRLLETGEYYVLVSGSDGLNEQRDYRKIRIIEMPKERRAIFFSDISPSGNATIQRVDSSFQNISQFSSPGQDILEVCVNSQQNQLAIVGHYSTGILSYDLNNASVIWADATYSINQTPRYMDLHCFDDQFYTTIYDREIRSYSHNGSLTLNHPTVDNRPELVYVNDHYLIVEQNPVGTETHFLYVYHTSTRAFLWLIQLSMDVIAICELEDDKVLVFGNDGNQARVFKYDIYQNGYSEPRLLPSGKLTNVEKMDGRTYAIAHETGLYSYTYSPNYLNNIRPGIIYQDVAYDKDNNRIIGATGNMLEELTVDGQMLHTVIHSDSIGSIDIHYTK